jgi:cytochrome c556
MRTGNADFFATLKIRPFRTSPESSMIPRLAVFAVGAAAVAASTVAQMKPDVVIEYRRSAMTMIGWNFSPMSAMVKGKIAFDAKEFAKHAARIQFIAPQVLEGFAKGSDKGAETDAKPEIWTHFDDFQSKLNDLVEQSKSLAEVSATGDEAKMKEQFKKLGGACKACHDKYKAE